MTIIGALPVTLQNGTTADATQVMADFNFIVNQVNANAVQSGYISPGSLVGIQVFTTIGANTYTPNAAATKAIVKGVGGGGAGGGTQATGANQVAVGGGGASGAYGEIFIASGLTSQTVTIGAGGTPVNGAAGGNGAASSFGTLLSAGGGQGGGVGTPQTPPAAGNFGGSAAGCGGTGVFLVHGSGAPGGTGSGFSVSSVLPGFGGSSTFGGGGNQAQPSASGLGGGGSGQGAGQTQAATIGFSGFQGLIVVYEFA